MEKMKKMKKSMIATALMLAVLLLGFTSCEKSEDPSVNEIEGKYIGSLLESSSLKSTQYGSTFEDHTTAVVSMRSNNQIEVHCFGELIDTTIMLDYYHHGDSVMVCLTGIDFENQYGHMRGEGHMSGGMMGDRNSGETEWMHHMYDEHDQGDDHFGRFNMSDKSFSYSFRMMDGTTPYYLRFHGIKE